MGHGLVERLDRMTGQVGTEVRRLHRPGPATGGHDEGRAEAPGQSCRLGVRRVVAGHRVAAHEPHPGPLAAVQPVGERDVDRMVVEGPGKQGVLVVLLLRPAVGAGVERGRVGVGVVELARRVESTSIGVDRHVGDRREGDRPPGLDVGLVAGREATPQERRTRDVAAAQLGAAVGEVDRGHPPAVHRARPGREPAIQLRQRLDLDDASPRVPHEEDPRTRGPAAPRTGRARPRRDREPGTTCTRSCSRASGTPSRPGCRPGRPPEAGR